MRPVSPARTVLSPAEDKTHLLFLLVIGAAAGALLLSREPSQGAHDTHAAVARGASAAEEATRPEIETAITDLARWLERTRREARPPPDLNVQLLALGRGAIESGDAASNASRVWEKLDALAAPAAAARPASLPATVAEGHIDDGGALATLAILLETGTPLDHELPLPSGKVTVRHLLELTLPALAERRATLDPWALDLLAFAVLGGMSQHRPELARLTLANLTRLERDQHRPGAVDGNSAPAPGGPERVRAELGARGAGKSRARELQLSASVFRALAVLAEPDLTQRGLRHLNALLVRYPLEREAYRQLVAQAPTAAQRAAVQADAIETLGRMEQALYGAHLAFRRPDRHGPAPRTATIMRRAANDALEHLGALQLASAADTASGGASAVDTARLARAAAQALRGLRAARIAT